AAPRHRPPGLLRGAVRGAQEEQLAGVGAGHVAAERPAVARDHREEAPELVFPVGGGERAGALRLREEELQALFRRARRAASELLRGERRPAASEIGEDGDLDVEIALAVLEERVDDPGVQEG